MYLTLAIVLLAAAAGLVAWWLWRRRMAAPQASVYERLQMDQRLVWHGVPVTVIFDYEPYLKAPSRRKVNVHTVQESARGERSIVGFCHDRKEDWTFKVRSIRGEVLVVRTGESMPIDSWISALMGSDLIE